jgi:hypothetical protein
MSDNPTRRTMLATIARAAAVPVAGVSALAGADPSPGPIERLVAAWRAEHTRYNSLTGDDLEADERFSRETMRLEHAIIAADAKTPREAYAALDMAREDFWRFHFEGCEADADLGQRLTLAALDKALAVLKPLAGLA